MKEREKENCTLTKAIFIHKGMLVVPAASAFNWIYCLSSLSLSLLSYYHARLAYSRVCLFNVSLRFDPPMVMMNNSAGDNICLMYQLEQYWKNSIYHNKLSIKFYWLAISIREEISTFIKRSTSLTRQREKNDRRIVFSLDINENYLWWSLNYAWRSRRLRIWINWNLHDEVYCKMIQQRVQC